MKSLTAEQKGFVFAALNSTPLPTRFSLYDSDMLENFFIAYRYDSSVIDIPHCMVGIIKDNLHVQSLIRRDSPFTLLMPVYRTQNNPFICKKLCELMPLFNDIYKPVEYRGQNCAAGDMWIAEEDEFLFMMKYRCRLTFTDNVLADMDIVKRLVQLSPKVLEPVTPLEKAFKKMLPHFCENTEVILKREYIKRALPPENSVSNETLNKMLQNQDNIDYIIKTMKSL